MKKFIYTLLLISSPIFLFAQTDIADARSMSIGTEVTVRGVVTHGAELGIIRYLQDGTGGIAAYPGSGSVANFPETVKKGDSILVVGFLKEFNNLLEIDPITDYGIIESGVTLPNPLVLTPSQVGEDDEGELVAINNVIFDDAGGVFSQGSSYDFTANGQPLSIFIRSGHPLNGVAIPLSPVRLVGIASQYQSSYQLLPRGPEDIILVDDFYLLGNPVQTEIDNNGFRLSWKTNEMGDSKVRYGLDKENLDQEVSDAALKTEHSIVLEGLAPGEFYYAQAVSNNGNIDAESSIQVYSTKSLSTGDIEVYFNGSVDESFSNGIMANGLGGGTIEAKLISLIDNAQTSIDFAGMNNNRSSIVDALNNAFDRGVVVRYIANVGSANLALSNPTPSFPFISGNVDALMHNKFVIVDAASTMDCKVWTGSMNFTSTGIGNNLNNVLIIQDEALAKAYTWEFEEMWGSSNPTPNVFQVKFGADKTNNTPHNFIIGDRWIENYFSPSDNTTQAIEKAVLSAEDDLNFALLTFTRNELGAAVVNRHQAGANVRGMIDNAGDQGTEYDYLVDSGVAVELHEPTQILHHKYAIIDANSPNSDPMVVTGSHNWSSAAENSNDENTLIIHDEDIANLFIQEFEERWGSLVDIVEIEKSNIALFPNPTDGLMQIKADDELIEEIVIYNMLGQMVHKTYASAFHTQSIDLSLLNAGKYVMHVKTENQTYLAKIVVQ